MQRINELLARADEPRYPPLRDPFAGRTTVGIEVRGLDFAYGEDKILEQLDLNIGAGEKVALVGASGGKSTLVQLLLGLYSAQRGGIRYGGCPWRKSAWTACANMSRWFSSIRRCSTTACGPT